MFTYTLGQLEIIAEQFGSYTHMVYKMNQTEDREVLQEIVTNFDKLLEILHEGAEYQGTLVSSIPMQVQAQVDSVRELWSSLKPSIIEVAVRQVTDPLASINYAKVEAQVPILKVRTKSILSSFHDLRDRQQRRMNQFFRLILAVSTLSLIFGVFLIRKNIDKREQREGELQDAEEKYRMLFESANDAIFLADTETGIIVDANRQAEELIGIPMDQIKGMHQSLLHPDGKAELYREGFKKAIQSGQSLDGNLFVRHQDGRQIPVEISGSIIELADRKFIQGIFRNVTDKMETERQLQQLSTAVTQSPNIVVITNTGGKFEYVNPKFTEMTGYKLEELTGKTPRILKSGEVSKAAYEELWKTIAAGKEWRGELHNKKKNGELFWVSASISPILDQEGKISQYLAIEEDVTDKKAAELEIKRLASFPKTNPSPVIEINSSCEVTFYNPACIKLLEGLNLPLTEIMKILPKNPDVIAQSIQAGVDDVHQFEVNIEGKTLLWSAHQVNNTELIHFYATDISELVSNRVKLKNYVEKVKAINNASETLSGSLDPQQVADSCVNMALDLFGADSVTIFLLDENQNDLIPFASAGAHADEMMEMVIKIGEGFTGKIARQRHAEIANRFDLLGVGKQVPHTPWRSESLMSAPLMIKDEIIGVLTLGKLGLEEFESEDLSFIENLADISAVSIQNARLFKKSVNADRVKSLFLANISHELRTPLNSLLGFSALIKEELSDKNNDKAKQYFEYMDKSSLRLMHTVHSILDISQIEADSYNINPEKIDLNDFLQDIVNKQLNSAQQKDIKLTFNSEVETATVKIDHYSTSQALSNILDNAIKYTDKGGIDVVLTNSLEYYLLRIIDTGIGIEENYLDRIFEPFTQESEGFAKEYQGIGLGMAVAKNYLKLNHIRLDVESVKGEGTTFSLTFNKIEIPRMSAADNRLELKTELIAQSGKKIPVLLVEDDIPTQILTEQYLKEYCSLEYATSTAEAKQKLKSSSIELILLDLSLDGNEDGLELARYLRTTKKWKTIPVIALTAHAFASDRDRCYAAGCTDYISKPINWNQLIEKIQAYVSGSYN